MCRHSRKMLFYGNNNKLAIDNLDFVRNSIAYLLSNKFYNLNALFSASCKPCTCFKTLEFGFAFKGRYY